MTLEELNVILERVGYPVAYSHFEGETPLPYIVYTSPYTSNFMADGKVYKRIDNVQIELYTDMKDIDVEKKLEDVLDQHELPYDASEVYIESEKMFQRIYEIQLI